MLGSSLGLGERLRAAIQRVSTVFGAEACRLVLTSGTGDLKHVDCLFEYQRESGVVTPNVEAAGPCSFVWQAIEQQTPTEFRATPAGGRPCGAPGPDGENFMLAVPLIENGAGIGAFCMARKVENGPWEEDEIEVLCQVGESLTSALANARLFKAATGAKEIASSHQFLQSVLDSIQDFISIVDRDYRIILVNKALAFAMDRPPEDLVGERCHSTYWGRPGPCEDCVTAQTFETGRRQWAARWDTDAGSARRFFERSTFPIKGPDGETRYVVECIRDATERKELEERYRAQRHELGRRVRELRRAYGEVNDLNRQLLHAEKMASIGQMASSMAHELDSPLSTIFGYSEMLEDRAPDTQCKQWLATISEQAGRCQRVVRRMLDFARRPDEARTPTDVNAAIERVLLMMEHVLKVAHVETRLALDPKSPLVLGNDDELQQVFFNLFRNAIDAMPKGGTLCISTKLAEDDGMLRIEVDDTGPGVPPEARQRIFEPFFTTKQKGRGTGLGLPICATIVRAHDGEIAVEDGGAGARFVLRLPAIEAERQPTPETDTHE